MTAIVHNVYLHRSSDCWIADMSYSPDSAKIFNLFGTTFIQLPYPSHVPYQEVIERLMEGPGHSGARFHQGADLEEMDYA